MKVSLNTIKGLNKRYGCADDVTKNGTDKLIEKVGAQLGGVDEVVKLGEKYQGIIIAKVVSCEKHPDADKLSLCKIDDGASVQNVERDEQGLVQVVCGAPNVRAGLTVAWLPPGATVPETFDKEPFVLEAREIRGQKSNGMLASPKELALGDSHSGILEIEGEHESGVDFAEAVGLKDEVILDIENKMFTHRPDCFGFLGIARELAGIQGMAFKSPAWYTPSPKFPDAEAEELPLQIVNELPNLVPRFTAITVRDVRVGPSPLWLQVFLAEMGQKSINNIVDYTNFYMLETGQPLHAYDYDKVKALNDGDAKLVVRNPHPGESVRLINNREAGPIPESIVIATDQEIIGMAGIMGGSKTEVDDNTKNIIIEAATFDMYSVRRAAMASGVFSDASTRFTKGQSPLQNLAVLAKIVDEIRHYADGKVAGQPQDDNHVNKTVLERHSLYPPVKLTDDFVNSRLGLKLSAGEMKQLLENVEFEVEIAGDELIVKAPFWRTDIELREDIVEEVGRLYGYDHLPLELPRRDLTPSPKDPLLTLKGQIRSKLAKAGANEVLTYSFVHSDLLQKAGQDATKAFQVANALSPDLQYFRLSLTPSLLDKVYLNLRAGYDEFSLFELGKTHGTEQGEDEDGLPREFDITALVVAAADKLRKAGAAYYEAREYLVNLAGGSLEFKPVSPEVQKYAVSQPFDPKRAALVSIKDGTFLGIVGEFKASVSRNFKLPKYSAGFEIDTTALREVLDTKTYAPVPRFPKVIQDITLQVPAELPYQELFDSTWSELLKSKPKNSLAELSPIDIYQKDDNHKNVTLRLKIASYERTLTDGEVNKLLDGLAHAVEQKVGAKRI